MLHEHCEITEKGFRPALYIKQTTRATRSNIGSHTHAQVEHCEISKSNLISVVSISLWMRRQLTEACWSVAAIEVQITNGWWRRGDKSGSAILVWAPVTTEWFTFSFNYQRATDSFLLLAVTRTLFICWSAGNENERKLSIWFIIA